MSRKVALIILYHGAEHAGNIPVLEKYYGGNFSHIWHLVPDLAPSSPEAAPNVISVEGAHVLFHGWIAQGLRHYFRDDYTHYFFIQDDLLLNPVINEENFAEYLGLDDKDCSFFPQLTSLYELPPWKLDFRRSCSFRASTPSLPTYAEAVEKFSAHGFSTRLTPYYMHLARYIPYRLKVMFMPDRLGEFVAPVDLLETHTRTRRWPVRLRGRLKKMLSLAISFVRLITIPPASRKLAYPMVKGISDVLVVSATDIKTFCGYCEAFAALKLHVETGLPTALVLTAKKINTQENDNVPLRGRHFWAEERNHLVMKYERSLNNLCSRFPDDCLFLHPVKLSEWNTDIDRPS